MKKYAIISVFILTGCEAIIPQTAANYKLTESSNALRACLSKNPGEPKKCETEKTLYEMDYRNYQAAMRGGPPSPSY